jgi:hypothetical protein
MVAGFQIAVQRFDLALCALQLVDFITVGACCCPQAIILI